MAPSYAIAALGCVALAGVLAAVYTSRSRAPVAPEPVPAVAGRAAQPPPAVEIPEARTPLDEVKPAARPHAPAAARPAKAPTPLPPAEGKAGAGNASHPSFTHFRVGDRNVKRILADGDRIWVATSAGVIRYNTANDEYRLFDARSGLLSNSIVYVGKVKGRIAVGSYGGGLSVLTAEGEKWETFGAAQGLADEFVSDALVDSTGDIWVATRSGINHVRGGALHEREQWRAYTVETTQGGLPSNRVYALAEGRRGEIWAATEGGIARFHQGAWRHWVHSDGAKKGGDPHQATAAGNPNFVVALAVDRAGAVWAGTMGGGLAQYDGARWTYFTRADGLPGNNVFMIHQDARHQLWIGTDAGLARLKDGKFKVLTTQDGLFSNRVFAMASTTKAIWVGGYGGVARIRDVH